MASQVHESDSYMDDQAYVGAGSLGPFLRHCMALVRRNLWLLVGIVAALLALALVITMLQTPKYTAQTTLEINERSAQILGDELSSESSEADVWDIDRFLNTQLDILRSRALAERVAQRLDLYSDERFFAAVGEPSTEEFESDEERRRETLRLLMENFAVRMAPSTNVAQLEFTSIDPAMSARIANGFAAEFIQATLQRRFDSSSYARNFVADQLEEARARLESSERELNAYARSAGLFRTRDPSSEDGNSSTSVTTESLMQLNSAANEAQAQRVAAEARWQAEQAQPLLSSPSVLANPTVQALQSRRSSLQAELTAARQRYFEEHPTVQRLSGELSLVERQLNSAATEARDAVRAQYVASLDAERALRDRVEELQTATFAEQDRSVRYNTLAREADTNRSIYEGLLQRFRELNASAGITASNIAIIDEARPPVEPSSPNLPLNLAIALLLGLVSAGAVLFFKDQLDDRIHLPEDVESKFGLKLLGVIPRARDEEPQMALADPKSPMSEAYSALRGTLLYSTREGLPPTLLVTSSGASEGKTTTSYAIARALARAGKRVLLVDADLRRPAIHRMTGAANRRGLSSILVGQSNVADAIVESGDEGLQILPAGPVPPIPAELLSSPRMYALLEELERAYDTVIIDSAPVLGLADSPELAALSGGVVMVVEAERGRGGQLKNAVRRLRAMRPVILGAVLTKFDPEKAGNQNSAYYGYKYYEYAAEESQPA